MQRPPRWSLRRRLLALFALTTLLCALVGAAAIVTFVRVDNAVSQAVDRVDPLNVAVLHQLTGMLDEETGLRGYLLTRDATFLAPYRSGRSELASATSQAQSLSAGQPQVRTGLADEAVAIAKWQRDYAQPILAAGTSGQVPASVDNLGKRDFDAYRASEARLTELLDQQRATARGRLSSATRARWVTIGVFVAVAVAVMVAIIAGTRRWVVVPLAALAAATRVVAAGDTRHRIDAVGPAEIADLAADVEAMRAALDREISSVREAELAARTAQEQIAEQAESLRRSNSELEQFAYVASHDLQEPLRKVASFCQLLQQRYSGQLDERADTYIEFAVDGAKRMQSLINDLLTFSRVGRTSAGNAPVDLDKVVVRATGDLATALEEAGATVRLDPLPTVYGDASLLTQLFVNLLGNAVKFRTEAPAVVTVRCVRDEAEWTFSCADNGIGIEPQYAEKIFVIFQRLHGKEAYRGTGIGLALCRKIVEYHGGRIWLDLDYTGGSRFCFTLPADLERTST